MTTTRRFTGNHKYAWVMKSISTAPKHATFASESAEEFAQKEYKNLVRRRRAPYKTMEFQLHTVVIDESGMINKVTFTKEFQSKNPQKTEEINQYG